MMLFWQQEKEIKCGEQFSGKSSAHNKLRWNFPEASSGSTSLACEGASLCLPFFCPCVFVFVYILDSGVCFLVLFIHYTFCLVSDSKNMRLLREVCGTTYSPRLVGIMPGTGP